MPTKVGHLAMNELILNQAADLPVNHAVELGDQDDIVTQLSMLRKEAKPLLPAFLLPFTGIEKQLALVDHQQDRTLFRFGSNFFLTELDQVVRCHLIIRAVSEISTFVLR